MGGGIFQIKAVGIQDRYFTSSIGKNFIKQVYEKYSNFAKDTIRVIPKENVDFGKRFSVEVPRSGDYINKMYLDFKLPKLVPTSGVFAGWTNSIGHAIIKSVSIEIGGYEISLDHGLFMEIWEELTTTEKLNDNKLIGKFGHITLTTFNATEETEYRVPLKFWFCDGIENSLPLFALKFNTIVIHFDLRKFEECVVYDGVTGPNPVNIINPTLAIEYLYIDEIERDRLDNTEFNYVITQTQSVLNENIRNGGGYNISLPFNHPCSELFLVIREETHEENNDWFNYSIRDTAVNAILRPPLVSAKLFLDGNDRFGEMSSKMLNQMNIKRYHTNNTDKFVYCIVFGENPESNTPKGTFNFSTISNAVLHLDLDKNMQPSNAFVFARNFNYLKISNGEAFIAFSS
jgi:hypothetical protein